METVNFYGQTLDCPADSNLTEWHTCPQCNVTLACCDCSENEQLLVELAALYASSKSDDWLDEFDKNIPVSNRPPHMFVKMRWW